MRCEVVHVGCGGRFGRGVCTRCGERLALVLDDVVVDAAGRVISMYDANAGRSASRAQLRDSSSREARADDAQVRAALEEEAHFADFAALRGTSRSAQAPGIAEEHPTLRGFAGAYKEC